MIKFHVNTSKVIETSIFKSDVMKRFSGYVKRSVMRLDLMAVFI